jgi:hypothetical protein
MKKIALGLVLLAMLTGCSRPAEVVIPSDASTWDKELAPAVKQLNEEDRKLATGFIMRAKMGEVFGGKGIPFGTTLGDAIAQQKTWLAEQAEAERKAAALKADVEKQQATYAAKVAGAVTVSLVAKEARFKNYDVGRYSDQQVFKIAVKNTSDKPIVGVSGKIEFVDVFDKVVGAVGFGISEKLDPGASTVWTGSRDYNQFLDTHRAVWNLEDGKYKTRFKPDAIVYADGTKLESPSQ